MNIFLNVLLWFSYLITLYTGVYWLLAYIDKYGEFRDEKSKTKLEEFPIVSVIIPAYNEEATIAETARSVLNLNYPHDKLELIMVNDGSKDRTLEMMEKIKNRYLTRDIRIISHNNMGKAASMNKAIRQAKGRYFACLDADSFVDKGNLKKMIAMFQKDPQLSIVTPAMKVKEPKTWLQKFQRLEYLTTILFARIMGHFDMIYVAPGPFSVYKKSIVKKLGGFEAGNLTEDMEIAYRMQKNNYKIRQCFDAYVHTIAPENLRELYKQRNRWYKGGFINFIKYRQLFLNPRYGDFGVFMMPVILALYIFSIISLGFFAYFSIDPIVNGLKNLYLINFNIIPHIKDILTLNVNFNILNLALSRFSMFALIFGISFLLLVIAHRNANESIKKHGVLHIIPYTFFHFIILSTFVIIILTQTLIGAKQQKW
ncbi:glycosyltransferase family 2 protein [Candidatus Woesearchaeota archaeon]|nr:glycosyltransferase family 2 protein [Candidatus Woesearchaeota archaeon]